MKLAVSVLVLLATSTAIAAPDKPRDEATAIALSVGAEVVSLALIVGPMLRSDCIDGVPAGSGYRACDALDSRELPMLGGIGVLLAPSIGHWYAGKGWTSGMGVRLAGVGVASVAGLILANCIGDDGGCTTEDDNPAKFFAITGGVIFAVGSVMDFVTIRKAVREENALILAPMPVRDGAGLAVGGRF